MHGPSCCTIHLMHTCRKIPSLAALMVFELHSDSSTRPADLAIRLAMQVWVCHFWSRSGLTFAEPPGVLLVCRSCSSARCWRPDSQPAQALPHLKPVSMCAGRCTQALHHHPAPSPPSLLIVLSLLCCPIHIAGWRGQALHHHPPALRQRWRQCRGAGWPRCLHPRCVPRAGAAAGLQQHGRLVRWLCFLLPICECLFCSGD